MVSHRNRGEEPSSARGGASETLGRLLFRLSTQLFGGRMNTPGGPDWRLEEEARPERVEGPAKPSHPAAEAARILERALTEAESMLGKLERGLSRAAPGRESEEMTAHELGELERSLRGLTARLEDALGRLAGEIERLGAGTAKLGQLIERLETPPPAPAPPVEAPAPPAPPVEAPAPTAAPVGTPLPGAVEAALPAKPVAREPLFEPGEQALGIVIAAVPGFQGLMDVQRGLSGLAAVSGAPVRRYKNGEALLEIGLREPVSATQIVETLQATTGRPLLIEEARPEALRLRLRFVDGDGSAQSAEAAVPDPYRLDG